MKKFTVLVALALLAATGTSYAVTCAYDNVPAATLLVPYFKVSRNGSTGADIPEGGVDTMVAITNVSLWGVVAHVTVWNKQSAAVLDFNVPMTGYDVATFRMRDILNGKLNVNPNVMKPGAVYPDPCDNPATIGFTQTTFQRFQNPSAADEADTLGYYSTPAFSGSFRSRVWTSLDEGTDYAGLVDPQPTDVYNPACADTTGSSSLAGDFTGYLTIDVTNYCTNFFPDEAQFYVNDAIATLGWDDNDGPNVLMGDVFFVDPAANAGNISGEVAVPLEFDNRLDWTTDRTFYNRYTVDSRTGLPIVDTGVAITGVPVEFAYVGDGREPLGVAYGYRYMNASEFEAASFLTVWRSDLWAGDYANLCASLTTRNAEAVGIFTWDEDENYNTIQGGGPSGDVAPSVDPYIWWESQRLVLADNADVNPGGFKFGWTRVDFPWNVDPLFHQAYVGIQHSAAGQFVSVGHAATMLDNDFTCGTDAITEPGNIDFGAVVVAQ
ncbi:MAG: hypothetical protein ACYC4P_09745 [Thermoanaerobaculia bacterium]